MEWLINIIQLIGGLILNFGYIPQIYQIIKTKSAGDLNLSTFISILIGVTCIEIYAIYLVIHGTGHMFLVTNSISVLISIVLVVSILTYKRNI